MISIVVPLFNEEESIGALYKEIIRSLKDCKYQILFIDDGSSDRSLEILKEIEKKDRNIKIYSFRKNQGKSEALTFGFQKAKGDYIVTLDADLQDIPSEIPKLLKKIDEGFDLVCGWRKNRQDSLPTILSSKLFNFLANVFWKLNLHDYNCGFKVYTKDVAKGLNLYGGLHRFIPLLIYQQGFTVAEVPIIHEKRKYGKSKYGFFKVWSDLPDLFTVLFLSRYSTRPLHFFFMVGGILFLIGVVILTYLSFIHFQGQAIGRRPLLFLGMLLVLSGFQVFFTGFLADLIINMSQRSDQRETERVLLKYEST